MAEISYQVMNILDDSTEDIIYDPTTMDWNLFDWTQGYFVHTMSYNDIAKPYLVSFAYYGTVEYEDTLMWLNNVEDPWSLTPGSEIWVPYLENLKAFIFNNIKRG